MPTPYSETYTGALAALGTPGAVGVPPVNAKNASPVVLTGTPATIVIIAPNLGLGSRVGVTGQVVGTNTSPGVDAELHMQILQDGVAVSPELISSMPTTGEAATISWTVSGIVITSAGAHNFSVQAWATGDGGITIGANACTLNFGPQNF